jgi:hypothetical protein
MAFIIKPLGIGSTTVLGSNDLYMVPDPKSALVSSVRLAHGGTVDSLAVNLYVKPFAGDTTARRLIKTNTTIAVGSTFVMDDLVTLGKGDKIQLSVVSGTTPFSLAWMVNGVERE